MKRPAELDDLERRADVLHVVPYDQWCRTVALAKEMERTAHWRGALAVATFAAFAGEIAAGAEWSRGIFFVAAIWALFGLGWLHNRVHRRTLARILKGDVPFPL